jgi:hypothetical protein
MAYDTVHVRAWTDYCDLASDRPHGTTHLRHATPLKRRGASRPADQYNWVETIIERNYYAIRRQVPSSTA